MNYLDITNLCLQELNSKLVTSFEELVKPDHKRILKLINRVNDVILSSYDWPFLLRTAAVEAPAGSSVVSLPMEMKLRSVSSGDLKLRFVSDYTPFLNDCPPSDSYSVFDNKLLITPSKSARTLSLVYHTSDHAADADGNDIRQLTAETDRSLIPERHVDSSLVFGVCLQYKSNPEHPKFKYWLSMYNTALANLRQEHFYTTHQAPVFRLQKALYNRFG